MTVQLIQGDCLEALKDIEPNGNISTITDPPFESEAHTPQRRVKRGGGVMEIESLEFDAITEELRDGVSDHLFRISSRWVLVFCQIEASHKWIETLTDTGLSYRRTCIWVKPDGMPQYSGDRPGMGYETIVACHAPGRSRWNGGGHHGVFTVNKISTDDVNRTGHQTQKPLRLMTKLISLFTDAGDTILDPFMGSGTTGVAAVKLGRSFIGIERDETYFKIAQKRIRDAEAQPALFTL